MSKYKRLSIQITPEQHERLRKEAYKKKKGLSQLIREALDKKA